MNSVNTRPKDRTRERPPIPSRFICPSTLRLDRRGCQEISATAVAMGRVHEGPWSLLSVLDPVAIPIETAPQPVPLRNRHQRLVARSVLSVLPLDDHPEINRVASQFAVKLLNLVHREKVDAIPLRATRREIRRLLLGASVGLHDYQAAGRIEAVEVVDDLAQCGLDD